MYENLLTKEADETNETYNKYNNDIFERKSSIKHKLYLIRKTFHQNPLYYVIIKIIIGFLLLILPFLFFFNTMHNSIENFPVSQFSKSALPLFLSVSLILFYLLILLFLKIIKVCKTM